MELKDTVELMNSDSYEERFKAEYHQLNNRINGLSNMLSHWEQGTLSFEPACSYRVLQAQLYSMVTYSQILLERAEIEKIKLF